MKVHLKHGKVRQIMHGESRNYRYVWDVSTRQLVVKISIMPAWNHSGVNSRYGMSRADRQYSGVLPMHKSTQHLGCSVSQPRLFVVGACANIKCTHSEH